MSELTLTPEQLQAMMETVVTKAVSTAIEESKKPAPPTAQDLAEIKQAQDNRLANAEEQRRVLANQRARQLACTHEHGQVIGGMRSHAVHVPESFPVGSNGYMLCQVCQVRVRPESGFERKLDPGAVYDTALFNKMYQAAHVVDMG